MGAGKNQLRFPLTAVNGIVTETLVNLFYQIIYSYCIFSFASDCSIQAI